MTTKAICADCGVDMLAIGEFYMVKDDIWRRAWSIRRGNYEMPGEHFLCIGCLEDRLGYTLTRHDFIDALVNHPKDPTSSKRLLDRLVGFELSLSTRRRLPRWLREADKRETDKHEIAADTATGRIKRCSIEAEANAALKPKSAP